MDSNSARAEAERWLNIAERLLSGSDLHGSRTFAIRARESDPRFEATEHVLAVVDTLIAGQNRISNQYDWYGILQLVRYTQSIEIIATQYRRLALLLDPNRNRVVFSDQAFRLVHDAWTVLSNNSRKALYDNELRMVDESTQYQAQPKQQQSVRRSPRETNEGRVVVEEERPTPQNVTGGTLETRTSVSTREDRTRESARETRTRESTRETRTNESARETRTSELTGEGRISESTQRTESEVPSFWTACPYCYVLYEYPKVYEECTLRCQNCRRAFHAVMIPSPPITGKETNFCCWGYFPLGISGNAKVTAGSAKWTPISPMFACPSQENQKAVRPKNASNRGPRVYYDDDDDFIDISDPSEDDSDDEWENGRKKKAKNSKGKALANKNARKVQTEGVKGGNQSFAGNVNLGNGENVEDGSVLRPNAARVESSKKAAPGSWRKRGAADLGKLDLNVEFSNEVEEPPRGTNQGNGTGHGVEDNIEGIGFFEGLDEFLSSLPILSVVADDKVKAN
ncbi:DnaJ domain containing protein [Quillaja saponaria]|uniref:DnaJ domain containing protein n=1 Tax=Quillaja saponaria TaxID=32244 RepID=A0AAD7M1P6_QUISA|nr:DnaJ domain containing protein [Quillaja saponaria]